VRKSKSSASFPLTPALSPEKREERIPPRAEAGRVNSSKADGGDTLSSGERAGVRGKVTLFLPAAFET
jgi:hypothetical protein